MHERPGDGDALLLAAREFARQARAALAEAEFGKMAARHLDRLLPWDTSDEKRDRCVLGSGQRRQQIELLEHEANRACTPLRALAVREAGRIGAEDAELARARREDPREDRDERGLAATRWSDEHGEAALLDGEIDAAERGDARLARAVVLGEGLAADRDGRRTGGGCCSHVLNTDAGSSRMTRRTPRSPARRQLVRIARNPRKSVIHVTRNASPALSRIDPLSAARPAPIP